MLQWKRHLAVLTCAVLCVLGGLTSVGPPTTAAPAHPRDLADTQDEPIWSPRINHYFKVQLLMPDEWELGDGYDGFYKSIEGVTTLRLAAWSFPEIDTLTAACASDDVARRLNIPNHSRSMGEIAGRPVCLYAESEEAAPRHALLEYPVPLEVRFRIPSGPWPYLFLTGSDSLPVTQAVETLTFPETPSADAYLRGVIDAYQSRYIFRDEYDLAAWETSALERLAADSTIADVYDLILELFDQLRTATQHDHLAFYTQEGVQHVWLDPSRERVGLYIDGEYVVYLVEPDSPAEKAGMQLGDRLITLNGMPIEEPVPPADSYEVHFERDGELLTLAMRPADFSQFLPAGGRPLTERIAYLETFGYRTMNETEVNRYLTQIHDEIRSLDAPEICWVLDLRRNRGGNSLAIIGGIGPFAGNGQLFGHKKSDYEIFPLWYEDGRYYGETVGYYPNLVPEAPYTMLDTEHTIAILVSEQTASAGELSALIVSTQPENRTRIFGEQTEGLSSTVQLYDLIDGAMVQIPGMLWVDLDGNTFPRGIIPDEPMSVSFDPRYGTLDDPLVSAAVDWLQTTEGCGESTRTGTQYLPLINN